MYPQEGATDTNKSAADNSKTLAKRLYGDGNSDLEHEEEGLRRGEVNAGATGLSLH